MSKAPQIGHRIILQFLNFPLIDFPFTIQKIFNNKEEEEFIETFSKIVHHDILDIIWNINNTPYFIDAKYKKILEGNYCYKLLYLFRNIYIYTYSNAQLNVGG